MTTTYNFLKDPESVLDYTWDWSNWLTDDDSILTSVVIVPEGIAKDSTITDSTKVTVWLSGGTVSTLYTLDCKIITANGRIDSRQMIIYVKDR